MVRCARRWGCEREREANRRYGMTAAVLHYRDAGSVELESGHVLNAARDNLVVVFHSLTADADPLRWWGDVIGPGRAIDTRRYAVLSTNLLGSCYGTTRVPDGVRVTPRDMARLTGRLVETLEVPS